MIVMTNAIGDRKATPTDFGLKRGSLHNFLAHRFPGLILHKHFCAHISFQISDKHAEVYQLGRTVTFSESFCNQSMISAAKATVMSKVP